MSRRLVIPDIHGCIKTFKALIEKISLTKNDSLFLLGDYIDRGPSSSGVIDFILKLQSDGYNVNPIRGNHEHEMLEAFNEYDAATFKFYARRFKSIDLLDADYRIKEPYLSFMSNLPFYLELPDYILVHGGIDFGKENPFDDHYRLLVLRRTTYDAKKSKKEKNSCWASAN
jgi:serine/threonine protein phosphatase 1